MLNLVLIRFDYANPVPGYRTFLPKLLNDQIVKIFPIAEPREIVGLPFQIQIMDPVNQALPFNTREWNYYNVSKTEHFCITETSIIYETRDYRGFDAFNASLMSIIDKFKELNPEFIFSRLGLRYVNLLENSSRDELANNTKIDASIKVNISPEIIAPEKMTRNLSVVEYQEEDFGVRVQYGFLNVDYPAKIVKWDFTLDIDASKQGLIYYEEIPMLINKMHESIQNVYSSLIGDER